MGHLLNSHCTGCKRERAVPESLARTTHTALQDGWLREVGCLSSRGLSSQAVPIHRVPSCSHVRNARGHRACLHMVGKVRACWMAALTRTWWVLADSWNLPPEGTVDPCTGRELCHTCMKQAFRVYHAPACSQTHNARPTYTGRLMHHCWMHWAWQLAAVDAREQKPEASIPTSTGMFVLVRSGHGSFSC